MALVLLDSQEDPAHKVPKALPEVKDFRERKVDRVSKVNLVI